MPPLLYAWVGVVLLGGSLLCQTAAGAVGPPGAAAAHTNSVAGPQASSEDGPEDGPSSTQVPGTTVAAPDVSTTKSSVEDSTQPVVVSTRPVAVSSSTTEAPTLEVSTERNVTQVNVICRSTPRLFPGLPTPAATADATADGPIPSGESGRTAAYSSLLTRTATGRGVEVALALLEGQVARQVVLDVEGCGHVALARGVPSWAEGLTFAIKGILVLRSGWWAGSDQLRQLSVRVGGWVGEGVAGLCPALPPTLETLDVSNSPMEALELQETCVPPALQRLEAARAALTRVALCTPALTTLYVQWNEVGGGLQWAACEGGVASVQYLLAHDNLLTVASTCGWPGLRTLDLSRNLLAGLDLTSCPSTNLTSLKAAHNLLVAPPVLPPTLLFLDLSHNHLSGIPVLTPALMEADLSYNKLVTVGKTRFKRARKLLHLSLAHNHLTVLLERDLAGLRNLRTLDISHNRLRHVAPSSLVHLQSLRRLHLQRNHLTTLDAHDLDALQPHAHATLHHNPWECSCFLLSALHSLQACPGCQHQPEELQCHEDGSWVAGGAVLRSCLQAVQAAQPPVQAVSPWPFDESDEDLSEEEGDDQTGEAKSHRAVMVVPGVVVVLLVAVTVALSYRLYHRHRRAITTRLAPFCGFCGYCAPAAINNNHNHHQRDQLSQMGNDSDTETEL